MIKTEKEKMFEIVDGTRLIEGYGQDWTWNVVDYLIENGVVLGKSGHWICETIPRSSLSESRNQGFVSNSIYRCSECGITRNLRSHYCPQCGSKMAGV